MFLLPDVSVGTFGGILEDLGFFQLSQVMAEYFVNVLLSFFIGLSNASPQCAAVFADRMRFDMFAHMLPNPIPQASALGWFRFWLERLLAWGLLAWGLLGRGLLGPSRWTLSQRACGRLRLPQWLPSCRLSCLAGVRLAFGAALRLLEEVFDFSFQRLSALAHRLGRCLTRRPWRDAGQPTWLLRLGFTRFATQPVQQGAEKEDQHHNDPHPILKIGKQYEAAHRRPDVGPGIELGGFDDRRVAGAGNGGAHIGIGLDVAELVIVHDPQLTLLE